MDGGKTTENSGLFLRRQHGAGRRSFAPRMPRRGRSDRKAALPCRGRTFSRDCRRRRRRYRDLHPGSAAIFRACRGGRRQGRADLREYPRTRRLVHRGRPSHAQDRSPAGRGSRTGAGHSLCHAAKRRRHPDLRARRTGGRDRAPAEGSSRRYRSDHAAGCDRPAARDRFPGGEGLHPGGQGIPRCFRDRRRRVCRAGTKLARRLELRSGAQWREVAMRHPVGYFRERTAIPGARSARRLSARRSR